jgi:hypothetical protein
MAPKSGKDKNEEGADPLPPAIIAQAEAAIFGNSENGRPAGSARRPSRARSEYQQYQNTISGSEGAALKK